MSTRKTISKAAWSKKAEHEINLASDVDTVVKIRLPNLPALVASGDFPNHLIDAAISVASGAKVTREHIAEQSEFYNHLVSNMLIEPAVTPEEVKNIPFEDIELLIAIGTRARDIDGLGNHIAGLDKSDDWMKFRRQSLVDADLEVV